MSAVLSYRASCPRRRAAVLGLLEQGGRWTYARLAEELGEPQLGVRVSVRELCAEGRVAATVAEAWAVGGPAPAVAEGGSQDERGPQLALFGGRR